MTQEYFRVYNRCKYDIGVTRQDNQSINIRAGNFVMLTANDIAFIEGLCANKRFFSQKMLVPVDDAGNEVPLEKFLIYEDPDAVQHLNDGEIIAALKAPVKKVEEWLNKIDDPEELHAIYKVAMGLDLPASKLKILNAKIPNKDWLETN